MSDRQVMAVHTGNQWASGIHLVDGDPPVYEVMVFVGGDLGQVFSARYDTLRAALRGHDGMVAYATSRVG